MNIKLLADSVLLLLNSRCIVHLFLSADRLLLCRQIALLIARILLPLSSATSERPPTEKRKYFRLSALAMLFATLVFPTPGGPAEIKGQYHEIAFHWLYVKSEIRLSRQEAELERDKDIAAVLLV